MKVGAGDVVVVVARVEDGSEGRRSEGGEEVRVRRVGEGIEGLEGGSGRRLVRLRHGGRHERSEEKLQRRKQGMSF